MQSNNNGPTKPGKVRLSTATLIAGVAGVAAVAITASVVVTMATHRRDSGVATAQARVTGPAETADSAAGTGSSAPVSSPEPATGAPSTSLPSDTAPASNAPAKLVNFPFQCPGASKGSRAPSNRYYRTDTPTNPVDFCTKKSLMGRVNPQLAVLVSRQGHTFVEDRHPAATSTTFPSEAAERAALHKDALPAGTTYTGLDFEVKFAPLRKDLYQGGVCPTFAEYVSRHEAALSKIAAVDPAAGSKWVTKVVKPGKSDLKVAPCHQRRIDMATRTVYLMEMADVAGNTMDLYQPNDRYTKIMNPVYEAVNTKCLSLKDAVTAATKAARDTGSGEFGKRPVRMAIPAGGKCARLYRYPSGRLEFIAFGS